MKGDREKKDVHQTTQSKQLLKPNNISQNTIGEKKKKNGKKTKIEYELKDEIKILVFFFGK